MSQADTKPQQEVTIWRGTEALHVCPWSRWCSRARGKCWGLRGRRPARHVTAGCSAAATITQRDEGISVAVTKSWNHWFQQTRRFCFGLTFCKMAGCEIKEIISEVHFSLSRAQLNLLQTSHSASRTCMISWCVLRVMTPITRNTWLSIFRVGFIINNSVIWKTEKIRYTAWMSNI